MSDATNNWGDRAIEDPSVTIWTPDPSRNVRRRRVPPDLTSNPPSGGLELWFKGGVGMFQDTAGTTPAVAASDPIARWEDQSGNGRHATQTTSGFRPLLITSEIDTVNGANCQGTLFHGLSLAATLNLTDYTIYCVGKRAASKVMVALGSATSWTIAGIFSDNNVYSAGDEGGSSRNVGYTGAAGKIMYRMKRTSGSNPVFRGGGQADTTLSNGGSGAGNGTLAVSCILARIGLGSTSSDDGICEILAYSSNDASTQAAAETYLTNKYPSATF